MRSALNETTGYSPLGLDGAPPKKTNTKGRADPFRGWWTRRLQSAGFPPSARKRRGRGSTQELARWVTTPTQFGRHRGVAGLSWGPKPGSAWRYLPRQEGHRRGPARL